MNKVVFIAGILTVCVVGGIFFCAGLFMNSYMSEKTSSTAVAENKSANITNNTEQQQSTPVETATQEAKSFLNKIVDLIPSKDETKVDSASQKIDQNSEQKNDEIMNSTTNVNIDSLLNEIVSSHDTADQCLTESVKNLNKEPVVMNNTKKYMIFVGYFANSICNDIAQLMMAKGYPIHIQKSGVNNTDSYMFCGPFKKKFNATKILTWLNNNGFKNAKLVSQDPKKPEEINLEEFEDSTDAIPSNVDFRQHNANDDMKRVAATAKQAAQAAASNISAKNNKQAENSQKSAQKRGNSLNVKRVIDDDLDEESTSTVESLPVDTKEQVSENSETQLPPQPVLNANNDNNENEEESGEEDTEQSTTTQSSNTQDTVAS